jgi:peptide-methionine (S)-S-oxide reductase
MHRSIVAVAAAAVAVLAWMAPLPSSGQEPSPKPAAGQAVATFAGGCFWCVEADFDKVPGVVATTSGFMGGTTSNPTYKQVTAGGTGHIEVVQIIYEPKTVSYQHLLDVFWKSVDPYDGGGQFCDRGESYTTAIFAHDDEQRKLADASKERLQKEGPLKQPIATEIRAAGPFTGAEEYHQNFYQKNPIRYAFYRQGCGRDARLEAIWGKKHTQ